VIPLHRPSALHKRAASRNLGYACVTMGTVINLNRYRKQKARKERASQAETNRRVHGRTKQERSSEDMRKELERRRVDNHKLDTTHKSESDRESTEPDPNE
jgi:hypothetical protein